MNDKENDATRKKILIVDDAPGIVTLTEKFLERGHYQTIPCTNDNEALNIIEQEYKNIDLVLLDLIMPNISGYEILKAIKENEKYKDILVVIFSTLSFKENIQKAKELGADGYIVNPVSGKELLNYVNEILKKKRK